MYHTWPWVGGILFAAGLYIGFVPGLKIFLIGNDHENPNRNTQMFIIGAVMTILGFMLGYVP